MSRFSIRCCIFVILAYVFVLRTIVKLCKGSITVQMHWKGCVAWHCIKRPEQTARRYHHERLHVLSSHRLKTGGSKPLCEAHPFRPFPCTVPTAAAVGKRARGGAECGFVQFRAHQGLIYDLACAHEKPVSCVELIHAILEPRSFQRERNLLGFWTHLCLIHAARGESRVARREPTEQKLSRDARLCFLPRAA